MVAQHTEALDDSREPDHRRLLDGELWRHVPGYSEVDERTFLDHRWQARSAVTKVAQLAAVLGERVSPGFIADVEDGLARAPMSLRVSPYLLSLVDWADPYDDPIRIQFIPVGSEQLADHPLVGLDSLAERTHSPVPGLTHRYPDKVLLLALDTCPVYCRFCTRSYAVGPHTARVEKVSLGVDRRRWAGAFRYIESRPEVEDVLVSGGDAWQLRPEQLRELGDRLLGIDHVRRIRIATKGPAVMPMKLLTDDAYLDALIHLVRRGRRQGKAVVVHTHFNHAAEITAISQRALDRLFQRGVAVRNQAVLLRRVNDTPLAMTLLLRRLGYVNVQPVDVNLHDQVPGVEELRTTLQTAIAIEKWVRGMTAGFNTPAFVVDVPGGGGKRLAHSYEVYDRENGISVFCSPSIKPGRLFAYFDPIDRLSDAAAERWRDPAARRGLVEAALSAATTALTGSSSR